MRFGKFTPILLLFILSSVAKGQNTNRIIAGYHLDKLSCALENEVTIILDPALRSYIYDHKLSALLISPQQDPGKVIGLCFDKLRCSGTTDFPISDHDYAQLIEYADHKAFERASKVNAAKLSGNSAELAAAVAQLNMYVADLQQPKKAQTRRFIGSVLVDSEPNESDLVAYVQEYKDFVKENVFRTLSTFLRHSTLTPGEPIVTVGSADITALDLEKVNPAGVETFELGTSKFKGAWVGSNFVFVPQSKQAKVIRDPTGLGVNETWVAGMNPSSKIVRQIRMTDVATAQ